MTGVWAVGNIGHEEGAIWWPLAGAYVIYPFYWHYNDDITFTFMVISAAMLFDTKAKKWRRKVKQKKSFTR